VHRILAPFQRLRHGVFWPPFLLLAVAAAAVYDDSAGFLARTSQANEWILDRFGWLFSAGTFLMVGVCVWINFSPLAAYRIGGPNAKPLLTRWRWFSIVLCTTVAIGVMFWATAEPLYHLHHPPHSLAIAPDSAQAAQFALSAMYLHWTFTPYAIYTLPALMFALAYYNMGRSFSLGSTLAPLFGGRAPGSLIDAICLYALVAGMAASLGTGVLTLGGGISYLFGIPSSPLLMAVIACVLVGTFIISSMSGLMKGIRVLSDLNAKIFVGLAIFVLLAGPTGFILSFGAEAVGNYMSNFFTLSLFTGSAGADDWPQKWTIFYWANWMAWAPITAMFLGRIGYGYTVREFVLFNWIVPALFGAVWMTIFSGTAIHMEQYGDGPGLYQMLLDTGPESVVYGIFSSFPLATPFIVLFVLTSFLSYVTAADSNTSAMGGISTTGISPESPEPGSFIKAIWGVTVGLVAWFMVSEGGIDGIKTLSQLGGLPALFLVLAVTAAVIRVAANPARYLSAPIDPARMPPDSE
jgi:glycine betaine transporter